jgi:hypothetical protein
LEGGGGYWRANGRNLKQIVEHQIYDGHSVTIVKMFISYVQIQWKLQYVAYSAKINVKKRHCWLKYSTTEELGIKEEPRSQQSDTPKLTIAEATP